MLSSVAIAAVKHEAKSANFDFDEDKVVQWHWLDMVTTTPWIACSAAVAAEKAR